MQKRQIFLGENPVRTQQAEAGGGFVEIRNEKYYRIDNYQSMPDFFMTVVSPSDLWMFISSNGSLTAGRRNRDHALFPYYTDDKIHDYRGITGSRTLCLVETERGTRLWEPFSVESETVYRITRNLYKNIFGNKILFEEVNNDLKTTFRYGWSNSDRFGWVRRSEITVTGSHPVRIDILDGIHNILPCGVDYLFQNEFSNLSDAYKKSELLPESRLGLFMLSSIPVDRAEPSESLFANAVWSMGPSPDVRILLSDRQTESFRKGIPAETETDIRGARGAYYLCAGLEPAPGETVEWFMAADVDLDSARVADLDEFLRSGRDIRAILEEDITQSTNKLQRVVAGADGLQLGKEELSCARHFSNTLFNVMRGGLFAGGYHISRSDFSDFAGQVNRKVSSRFREALGGLPETLTLEALLEWAADQGDPDLERICMEYLPLTFSRRHGDPSRPWNIFSIDIRNEDGSDKLNYQGNWRDIFQNWEALSLSFPLYLDGMLGRFLNASTADGYNPYRITREGLDWECPDPGLPWANIGYWGDHQIIYLQKLLEQAGAFLPGMITDLIDKQIFVFANIPYRLKSYEEIEKNPKNTIEFDHALNERIEQLTEELGADGKLLRNATGEPCRASLCEKILVTLLAKMTNFIPEAGIWLNTQRPEWNDANNALVGNGVSMVTLYYLRRFLNFWEPKFREMSAGHYLVSEEVTDHLHKISTILGENQSMVGRKCTDEDRYRVTKALGQAGSEYREKIYRHSFSGVKKPVEKGELAGFMHLCLYWTDWSITANERPDGLFHAYNLVSFAGQRITIRHLYEMLEGQVAVLSSGALPVEKCLGVLDALKSSDMFRSDQYSYMLYPDRRLPRFNEKNNLSAGQVASSKLLEKLIEDGDTSIVTGDSAGKIHFNGSFRNAQVLKEALEKLDSKKYGSLAEKEMDMVLDIYEQIFDHQSFTGRSGTFFGYEGLGSIYWHMVSKLLLAVQECYFRGIEENAGHETTRRIAGHYYEIKAGIGLYKSPSLYGAFPTDAYSHTPAGAGAKQPGLTGQVKEDVICRFGELGIRVKEGRITFRPALLNRNELLDRPEIFICFGPDGQERKIALERGQMAFTFCQVPVVYTAGDREFLSVLREGGKEEEFTENTLPPEVSREIFARTGRIQQINYHLIP